MKSIQLNTMCFRILTICLSLLFFGSQTNLEGQCSEIYFYRHSGGFLQSDTPLMLIQDGENIATVRQGDRYKAIVCTPGTYEFIVKTSYESLVQNKETVHVEAGENYYLKIGMPTGVEIPKIGLKSDKDGKKDLKKVGKFKGSLKNINIATPQIASASQIGTSNTQSGGSNQGGGFQKSISSNGFQFDIVDISKAGSRMQIDYLITNNTGDDKKMTFSPAYTSFYNDLGNFVNANEICLMNSCKSARQIDGEYHKYTRGFFELYEVSVGATVIPYGIPVKARIVFNHIKNDATQLVRGGIQLGISEKTGKGNDIIFKINYNNIPIPSDVSSTNPNIKFSPIGENEVVNASILGTDLVINSRYKNTSGSETTIAPTSCTVYDSEGNSYVGQAISFAQSSEKERMGSRNNYKVLNNTEMRYKIFLPLGNSAPTMFKRVDIGFDGYVLSWTDVAVRGKGSVGSTAQLNSNVSSSQSSLVRGRQNYIAYNDFESKVKNNEVIVGKKIILEKIYFKTGSDAILPESHNQLNKMAELLKLNKALNVEISGHTDNVGDDISNMLLSQKRADAIRYYMIAKSINPQRVTSLGKGESEPISNNQSTIGRKENRRVEIEVVQ